MNPLTPYEPIDVIVCTMNTPACTEACLLTLLYYNRDMNLRPILRYPPECEGWAEPLCDRLGIQGHKLEALQMHDVGLTQAYKESDSRFLFFLDSDVTFHGHGLVRDMMDEARDNVYAVGPEHKLGEHWAGENPRPAHWTAREFVIPPRVPTHCLLVQKSDIMDKFVNKLGFHCALINGPDIGQYHDTSGLFGDVMEIAGLEYGLVAHSGRMHHWQSVSWIPGRYDNHLRMFEQIIIDHQPNANEKSAPESATTP